MSANHIHHVHLAVDWPQVLNDLRQRRVKTGLIARYTGLSTGNIREYRLGVKSPMHANGERIIEFWIRETGKQRVQLPLVQVY